MEVTYELDRKDIVAFQLHACNRILSRFRDAFLLLCVALFALNYYAAPRYVVNDLIYLAAEVVLILLLFSVGRRPLLSWVTGMTLAKKRHENGITGRHRVTLAPEKLVETTSVNELHTLWRGVDRVEQNDDYIYVFNTPQAATIVPKRAFLDARQAAEFFGAAVRFHEGARADVPRPTAAEIERAARLGGRPASQFDERRLSPVERVFSE